MNFQQNTPDIAIQHSCGASAERTARESALPMHCTPLPPPPRPASRLLASPKVTVHTKSTHYKRSRKAPGEKPQAPPAAEFKRPNGRCCAASRLAGESGPGASSSPWPHLTSATASGREIRSQEAKHAATAGSRAESRGGHFLWPTGGRLAAEGRFKANFA